MSTPLRTLTLPRLPRALPPRHRPFTTTRTPRSSFPCGPAPPRLPRDEQALFEQLQKASTGAFSQPQPQPQQQPAPDPTKADKASPAPAPAPAGTSSPSRVHINQSPLATTPPPFEATAKPIIPKGDEFHPNMRRGAPPEFEGDVNPKTGEVGGPKNEPLRWGGQGDWSYNGRVSDF